MTRAEQAHAYHKQGFNCCQSVLAAFSDRTGLSVAESLSVGGGFGAGAGTGELCGAISGALMVLGLAYPTDAADPGGSKRRATGLSKEFQRRFREKFGAVRCQELLPKRFTPDDTTPAARDLGLTGHCDIMVVTAAEIAEELLPNPAAEIAEEPLPHAAAQP